jgi:hypothetical protein
MEAIKVLAFDTGGTILDWHSGLVSVLAECGARCGVERDWNRFANEYRRRSLGRMLGAVEPSFNIDDVHRVVLDELLDEDRGIVFPMSNAGRSPAAGTSSMPGPTSCRGSGGCGNAMSAFHSRS